MYFLGCSLMKLRWWVLLLGFVVNLESKVSIGCLEYERVALLKLKDALNHPNGTSLASWKGLNCCNWESVKCDNSTKRVTQLLLDGVRPKELSNLQWSLNASYFLPFQHLQVLDLSTNYLSGLSGKFRLNNIQTLLLSDNRLTEVPSFEFLSSPKLEDLEMELNSLSGSIPESITALTSLKYLSLGANNFSGSLLGQGGICKLKNLIALNLAENYFVGQIPECLANLSALQYLDVSDNHFEGPLPSSTIYNLKSLVYISLRYNHFKGAFSFSLLANHSNLQFFILKGYNKSDVKVETENPPFSPSFQLKVLSMTNCTINEPSYKIPTFLHNQHDLRILSIGHNSLVGSFPNWLLANNSKLNYFLLNHNSFFGPLEINSTSKFQDMEGFDVSSNPIGGGIPSHVGLVFPNLAYLNMSSCLFRGNFPSSLGDLRQINRLDLSHNNLNGPFLSTRSNFTNLVFLHLANNNFIGKIPIGIMNSSELKMLDLSGNQISGGLPSWIGNFHNMTLLILSHNLMQDSIPLSFCKLTKLAYLDLSYNNLSGTLPSCVNMPFLRYLHLQGNQFNGVIPSALAKSQNLLTMDLMNNNFFGHIPKWIGSFLNLKVLILKGNKFEGLIPIEICHLRNISILDISHNNISGGVMPCFNNISFGKVDYSLNATRIGKVFVSLTSKLSGFSYNPKTKEFYVEVKFGFQFKWYEEQEANFMSKNRNESYKGDILNLMSGLDLSSNNMIGHIPPQIGYLNNLHTLNLSNNHLTGPIPETFSNLRQIESLDLSHNMLSDGIPSQLTRLYSLSVFSVAFNNLSGRIPERVNQFGTFEASCYQGNLFLCGPPLDQNCSFSATPPRMKAYSHRNRNDDFKDTFVWSFIASFAVAFLGVIAFLYFNYYFYIPVGSRKYSLRFFFIMHP